MTDKQLRTLSKTQLYELLYQQELEIERLNEENKQLAKQKFHLETAGSLAEASLTVTGIMQAAQSAADIYLESVRNIEDEKLLAVARLEEEAKLRAVRMVEIRNAESLAKMERLVVDILRAFDCHVSSMASMKEELTELIKANELQHLISGRPVINR